MFSSLPLKPTELYMYYFIQNSENRQVVDSALIRACVVCEVLSNYFLKCYTTHL